MSIDYSEPSRILRQREKYVMKKRMKWEKNVCYTFFKFKIYYYYYCYYHYYSYYPELLDDDTL